MERKNRIDILRMYGGGKQDFDGKSSSALRQFEHSASMSDMLDMSCFKLIGFVPMAGAKMARSSIIRRNIFGISNILSIGGGEIDGLKTYLRQRRFGGGPIDSYNYMLKYKKETKLYTYNPKDVDAIISMMCLEKHSLRVASLTDVMYNVPINFNSNPGPSYIAMGYRTKFEAHDTAFKVCKRILNDIGVNKDIAPVLYGVAGRSKLADLSEIFEKLSEGNAVGRAVWMSDMHEAILSGKFTKVLLKAGFSERSKFFLGFNKFSSSSNDLYSRMYKYNLFIDMDYSSYDSSEKRSFLRMGFAVVKALFVLNSNELKLLEYLEHNFIFSHIVLGNGVVLRKETGNPSGSGWVSIINTILNIHFVNTMILTYKKENKIEFEHDFVCYGDDAFLAFKINMSDKDRFRVGVSILKFAIRYMLETFGVVVSEKNSKVFLQMEVKMASPKVPKRILDGSRATLAEYVAEQKRRGTYDERFWKNNDLLYVEPAAGLIGTNTHRWSYRFAESPKFLSYYFKEDGKMIRPTWEVLCRLVNPSRVVKTLDQHREMLLCALVENLGNAHTRNHIMHWLYDCTYMDKLGLTTYAKVNNEVTKKWSTAFNCYDDLYKKNRNPNADYRGWYRHQKLHFDLVNDYRSKEFLEDFKRLVVKLQKSYSYDGFDPLLFQKIRRFGAFNCYRASSSMPLMCSRDVSAYRTYLLYVKMLHGCDLYAKFPKYLKKVSTNITFERDAFKKIIAGVIYKGLSFKQLTSIPLRGGDEVSSVNSSTSIYHDNVSEGQRYIDIMKVTVSLMILEVRLFIVIRVAKFWIRTRQMLIALNAWFCRKFCKVVERDDRFEFVRSRIYAICMGCCPLPTKRISFLFVNKAQLKNALSDVWF